jgi:hypothetical protein
MIQRLASSVLLVPLLPSILLAQSPPPSPDSAFQREDTSVVSGSALQTSAPSGSTAGLDAAPSASQFELPDALRGLKIGTLTYISYQSIEQDDGAGGLESVSRFNVTRGYIDIRKDMTSYFGFRATPDVHQDGSGDWKLRLKYLYGAFKWAGHGFLGKSYAEVGLAHVPWLDFEEHINRFRMQGTMFLERNGLFNSADVGILVGGDLGEEMPEDYRAHVNSHYAGRWGSFGVGVYNGGGYHAASNNNNLVIEGRLSLRPVPNVVPGLQVSLLGITGKGNTADSPDWDVLAAMLSYESRYLVATGQYYDGTGNQSGTAVDGDGDSLDQDGYSVFAEIRLPQREEFSVFSRYGRFDTDANDSAADVRKRFIIGAAWQFLKGNYWVVDYDRVQHSEPGIPDEHSVAVTLQINY